MNDATRFPFGAGADPDWRRALGACLDQLEDRHTGGGGAGLIYLSDQFAGHAGDILTALRARTGVNDWVGTTGIGIVAGSAYYFDEPALSAMILPLPTESYAIRRDGDAAASGPEPWFGILHGNPEIEDLPGVIDRFAQAEGGYWVGGLAASRHGHPMIARSVGSDPVSGLMLGPATGVQTALTQGCSPIGPLMEITRAQDNLVIELDGRPAYDVFADQIGEVLARNLNRIPGFIFAGLPVDHADTGDYLVRDIAGVDPDQGIVAIAAEARVGARMMFCRRDAASADHDMTRMLDDLERRLDGAQPRGGVYFSCLGRGPSMFGDDKTEAMMITERFGADLPLTGFFCNGEVSNGRLYTYTGVLSLFV